MDFEIGQTLGDYEILRVLGAGGMGKVYQVRNYVSHRVEAMKVLLPALTSEPELADRFLREIRISASLDHPNIAALRTAQRVNDQLIMVMEYVEGSTLDGILRKSRIPADKGIQYTTQALSALSYAHSKGVIHRDIKPGNIMLTPAGSIKLMDFGIAKLATDSKLTKTGLMVGSVYYMSPEQIEGRELDARSDLYSLGITLYELTTGQRPFSGDSEYKIMAAHLKQMPQPPRDLDHSLPQELNDIIMMALAKDPAKRFQSADAFQRALTGIASHSQPQSKEATGIAAKPNYRLAYMLAGSVATLLVIAGAIVELPKFFHASAGGSATPANIASNPVSGSGKMQDPIPSATMTPPDRSVPASAARVATPVQPVGTARGAGGTVEPKKIASAQVSEHAMPVPVPQQSTSTVTAPPETKPAPPPADAAALADLRERMMLMAARMGAATTSVQNLQREQARQGLSLRSDVVAMQQRINYQMDEAESSLKQSNSASAKQRLDAAERDLEKLESFLGK